MLAALAATLLGLPSTASKPAPACSTRTVCPALFYYQGNDPADLPVINRHALVVLNQDWQLAGMLPGIDEDTIVLYYHLLDFCVENGPFYEWPTVNQHEEWFLHDAAGNRIRFPGVPLKYWYMDVANPDYMQFKITQYQKIRDDHPGLDGFFLDGPPAYGTPGPQGEGFARYTLPCLPCYPDTCLADPLKPCVPDGAHALSCVPDSCPVAFRSQPAWDALYVPALAALRTALTGALVLGNDFLYAPFNAVMDGALGEHMFHPSFWGDFPYYLESQWLGHVQKLADPSLAGRTALILSGATDTSDVTRWLRFSLASYLLGRRTDDASLFTFTTAASLDTAVYHPLYDLDLGAPTGAMELAQGVYRRDYEDGVVLVNPTPTGRIATLDSASYYRDLDGATVHGSVMLPPNSAQILTWIGTAGVEPRATAEAPRLGRPRPNPATGGASLEFSLPRPGAVRLAVCDVAGRTLRVLLDRPLAAGAATLRWDGTDDRGRRLAPGVFFVRLVALGEVRVRTLVLLE
ncbi:MAG: hypothetical protein HZC42_05625 [Candidatus Eisenbacteria bacterium]|nr:hypothetical protein [Candidatus Eisenbacteria bacterium]